MGGRKGKRAGSKSAASNGARPRPAREMVRCPTCGAAPGTSCNSSDGKPHRDRSLLRPAARRAAAAKAAERAPEELEMEQRNAVDSVTCPKCGAWPGEPCEQGETHPGRLGAYGRAMDLARKKSRGKLASNTSRSAQGTKPRAAQRGKSKAKKQKKGVTSSTLKVQPYQASKTSNSKHKRMKANPRTSPRSSVKLWTGKR